MTIEQKTLTFPTNMKFIFFYNVDRLMKEKTCLSLVDDGG